MGFTLIVPPGSRITYALGINTAGEIVGHYAGTDGNRGFKWSNGVFTIIDPLGYSETYALGINTAGEIVGHYTGADLKNHGFKWSNATLTTTVQTNPAGRSFTVDGVNYNSTQTFNWQSGAAHTIGTTSPQTGSTGTQYVWSNWSDDGAITHTVSPTANATYTANFTTPVYDLSVEKVEPVQVVYGDDVPLVQGKATAVKVTVKTTKVDQLKTDSNIPDQIGLEVEFENKKYPYSFNKNKFKDDGTFSYVINPTNPQITPQILGSKNLTATIDPPLPGKSDGLIVETDESNNKLPQKVNVVDTKDFSILYVPINRYESAAGCYPSISYSDVLFTASTSNEFIKGVCPVAPDKFLGSTDFTGIFGTKADNTELEMTMDYVNLGTIAKLLGYTKVFGVVSIQYWECHGFPKPKDGRVYEVGVSESTGIITNTYEDSTGDGSTAAHELGHLFGQTHEYEEAPPYGNPADDGFWVDKNIDKTNTLMNFYCFMGRAKAENSWTDKCHYLELMNILSDQTTSIKTCLETTLPKQQNRQNKEYDQVPTKPLELASNEYLIISGVLNKDGTFVALPWYSTSNSANVDVNDPNGNYSVRLNDASGQVISQTAESVKFSVIQEPGGTVPVDTAPFVVKVPYSPNVASVQILKGTEPIKTITISGKLLRDTINAIPDSGFNGDATQQRSDLLGKVDVFESYIALGKKQEARQLLVDDLKPNVQQLLIDGYTIQTALQLTKLEVISVIDGEINRLTGPTAATVTVSGRVTTSSGRGITKVQITMTDTGGNIRTAITSSFGYYRFTDVAAGETYIFSASGKRLVFSQTAQVLNINGDNNDVNFIGYLNRNFLY